MDLGDAGRKTIKGHELEFYLDAMSEGAGEDRWRSSKSGMMRG